MIDDIGFLNRLGYHPDSTSIDQYYEPVQLRPVADPLSEISISEEELFGEDTNLLGNVI